MKTNRQKVRKWMRKYDKELRADDPRFGNTVIVKSLDDFSFVVVENAFCIATIVGDTYYMVFPEHFEPSLYEGTEFFVKMYKRVKGEYIQI